MTGQPPIDTKTFCFNLGTEEDPLRFDVVLFEEDGQVYAKIIVHDGYADFNALFFGDDTQGNSTFAGFTGRDSSLNLNGAQGSLLNGLPVEWDGAVKLSSAGLGTLGADKLTFLGAGDYQIFKLDGITSLDQIDFLGVRATSTSTPDGSIKAIGDCHHHEDPPEDTVKTLLHDDPPEDEPPEDEPPQDEPPGGAPPGQEPPRDEPPEDEPPEDEPPAEEPPEQSGIECDCEPPKEDDRFPEWPQDISNVVFHFDTDGDGKADYFVKVDDFAGKTDHGNDLDDFYDAMLDFIGKSDPNLDPDATLIGVSIKGGTQPTQYYLVQGNTNGADPDPDAAPDTLMNTGPGTDTDLDYKDFAKFYKEWEEDEEGGEDVVA